MNHTRDKAKNAMPAYKARSYFATTIVTAVVLVASVFFIWQIRSNAVNKIDTALSESQADTTLSSADSTRMSSMMEVSRTDPVGFDLANYMQANYDKIVLVVYFVLAALALATVARFVVFLATSLRSSKFYPDNITLEFFLNREVDTWEDFYDLVQGQDHRGSRFWRILKDSVMVTNASGKYDHLYLHIRNRIDRISEYLTETALYDSIATASPAAGFFGTLVGLLFIFSQSQAHLSNISQSPAFSIGMKVAIITSLWGLFNLGLAIICSYFTRRIAQNVHNQMVMRAVAVCDVVESLRIEQHIPETERDLVKENARV